MPLEPVPGPLGQRAPGLRIEAGGVEPIAVVQREQITQELGRARHRPGLREPRHPGRRAEELSGHRHQGTARPARQRGDRDRLAAYLARLHNLAGDRPLLMSELGLDAMRNGEAMQAEVLDWQIRTTFAGGILNTYTEDGEWNRDDISQWLRAPEVVKENYANGLPDGELPRGMPNLGLSERTISDLVAYLETLGEKPSAEILAATEVE